jgi:large subunit ribosomal protein L21
VEPAAPLSCLHCSWSTGTRGYKVTSEADALSQVTVTAEIIENLRGPKIVIQKFKNKTGYKKRQGHRSELTKVKVTSIA